MSAEEDLADVRRVREGDVEAFSGIVRRWQGPLLNLAYRYCRDRGMAEELTQEAFLRVFRKLHLFREEATFSTWMFSVATRLYISHMRRYRPPVKSLDDLQVNPWGEDGQETTENRDREEMVRRAVSGLPGKFRDAIIFYYFLENDLEGAAAALEIAPGTLKSRLHRARKLLETKFGALLKLPEPMEA